MLSSLVIRLGMVALTMAIVCWIGWTVPASRDAETLHAQGRLEVTMPQAPSPPPPQQRVREFSRQPAPAALDVNLATEQDLERLPGIGPVLARRIVQYREAQGTFQDIEQLRRVKGIGKKTFERIRAFVVVGPPVVTRPARKTA